MVTEERREILQEKDDNQLTVYDERAVLLKVVGY